MRISEVCKLRVEDIHLDRGEVFIRQSKCDRDRIVVIPDLLISDMACYIGEKTEGFFLENIAKRFPAMYKRKRINWDYAIAPKVFSQKIKKYTKLAGLPNWKRIHPHTLRHSYAVHLLNNRVNLRTIQISLGHSHLFTTQKYLNLTTVQIRGEINSAFMPQQQTQMLYFFNSI